MALLLGEMFSSILFSNISLLAVSFNLLFALSLLLASILINIFKIGINK